MMTNVILGLSLLLSVTAFGQSKDQVQDLKARGNSSLSARSPVALQFQCETEASPKGSSNNNQKLYVADTETGEKEFVTYIAATSSLEQVSTCYNFASQLNEAVVVLNTDERILFTCSYTGKNRHATNMYLRNWKKKKDGTFKSKANTQFILRMGSLLTEDDVQTLKMLESEYSVCSIYVAHMNKAISKILKKQ